MKKFLKIILCLLLIIIILVGGVYYFFFYPKVDVKPLSSDINLDNIDLTKKLLPNDLNITMKNINIDTEAKYSDDNITDILILSLNKNNNSSNFIEGIKTSINQNTLTIYMTLKYNSIPLQGKLIFSAHSKDGKGVFHYESGKLGFIDISKEKLFSMLNHDSDIIQIDKNSGDIVMSLKNFKTFSIKSIKLDDGNLSIHVGGKLNVIDFIKEYEKIKKK